MLKFTKMIRILKFGELFKKNKKGIFGLTSVQQFFAVILGIALLAYVIVIIMGTLQDSTIIPAGTLSKRITNESGFINDTAGGYTLANNNVEGFTNPSIVIIINLTGSVIPAGNYTLSSTGILKNKTSAVFKNVNITYDYNYDEQSRISSKQILSNTSAGITSFFSSINPVYAILAILVIILVLTVLVRVVAGGNIQGRASSPQL